METTSTCPCLSARINEHSILQALQCQQFDARQLALNQTVPAYAQTADIASIRSETMQTNHNNWRPFCLRTILGLVFLLAIGAASQASRPGFQEEKGQKIEPNHLIEGTLMPPKGHHYEISLVKGQFLLVTATSERFVLSVGVVTADDKPLANDSVLRAPSNLMVSLIAPETANYRISVSFEGHAPSADYKLLVTTPQNPQPDFFVRARAQKLLTELGALYYQQKDRAAFLKMPEVGEEASRLFGQLEKPKQQADALNLVAEAWRQLGEQAKAIEVFERALEISRAIGYRLKEAETLTFIGMCRHQISDYQHAIASYYEAIPVWEAMIANGFDVKNMLGWTRQLLGDSQAAIGEFQQAEASFQQAADSYGKYRQEGSGGLNGDKEWNFGMAFCLRGLGRVYGLRGEKQKAMDALTQAIEHYNGAGEDYYSPLLLNEIGELYASLGEETQARELYEQALKLEERMGSRATEAQTLYLIGRLHKAASEWDEAARRFYQSLEIRRGVDDWRGQAAAFSGIGEIYAARAQHTQALSAFEEALAIQRKIGDRFGEGGTLGNLGATYAAMGDEARAVDHLNQSLAVRRALGDREGEANALYHQARLARDGGQLEEARALIEASLKLTESIRSSVFSQELRASYLGTMRDYYEFYIDLLMQLHERRPAEGHDRTALQASEMARARSLLDSLAEARVDIRSGVDADLLARERELQQRLSAKSEVQLRLQTQRGTDEALAALAKEIQMITAEFREVLARIRAASPRYAALTQPQPLAAAEIQQLLDGRTQLLEYSLGTERSFLWAVTRDGVTTYVLPPRAWINASARRVYDLLTGRNHSKPNETSVQRRARIALADKQLRQATSELSRMILSPVAARLKDQRLLVVAQEALQFIPFAILQKPSGVRQPLIVDHEIAYLPSASVLGLLRQESAGRQPAPQQLAVIADPVFSADDVRVVSRASASPAQTNNPALLRALKNFRSNKPADDADAATGETFNGCIPRLRAVDFAANRALVTGVELNRYRIVHFATHALINTAHPELSGIVLSLVDEQGRAQDGFLPAHEIYNLQLSADLVVLSACQTGLGKEVRGEGLVGMTRSFMHAGATRVVVSLWSQRDKETAELMNRFYRLMLGPKPLPPSQALRAAQLEMMKSGRWPSPYFWAGFTLQGDYR